MNISPRFCLWLLGMVWLGFSTLEAQVVHRINFSNASTTPPSGYERDSGQPFGLRSNGESYGWMTTDGLTPLDLTANGRNRNRAGISLLRNTLMHLQYGDVGGTNGNLTEGIWEIVVPNGTYQVTVEVGDQPNYDSQHSINVEGVPALTLFQSTSAQEYTTAIVQAVVSDGRLTIDAFGGTNTKLNAVEIQSVVTTPPTPLRSRISFTDSLTPVPSGWVADFGRAYALRANGRQYGWVAPGTGTPIDLSNLARNQAPSPDVDVLRETLLPMRYADVPGQGGSPEGDWEFEIANGTYQVMVQVGSVVPTSQSNTVHAIRAEGQSMISFPVGNGQVGTRQAMAIVSVTDGRLTLDAANGTNTNLNWVTIDEISGVRSTAVLGSLPADGDTGVVLNPTISANFLNLPNPGPTGATSLDNSSITSSSVQLYTLLGGPTSGNGSLVSATVNGTGGGDAINLTPDADLAPNTWYRLVIDGVTDLAGEALVPFSMVFRTGSSSNTGGNNGGGFTNDLDQVAFTNAGAVASGNRYTTLTMGPDGRLYGLTIGGDIYRWTLNGDGTLANQEVLAAWKNAYGNRTAIGLVFAPNATASNLIAYVSHCSSGLSGAPAWDGRLSRLTGANLQTEQLVVTNLPRSIRDHLTNSIVFDPNDPNVLYFNQGSNSAGGAADGAWGNRPERLLSAACLRLDLTLLPGSLPLDAQTSMTQSVIDAANVNTPTLSDGTYNPYYVNAPLTLFATGVRNAYDLVWHSNGQMYIPTNGTAGGSNSPASVNGTRRPDGSFYDSNLPGFDVAPAIGPNQTQRDWLFRIDPTTGVGYYGHPNPLRGEFVLNRGNPDESDYPVSLSPDPNYRGAAFDFEFNKSPNGVIEYRSNAHNGNLQGALIVCRYSGGSDLMVLLPDGPNGDIGSTRIGLPGMSGLQDPLDLVEDVNTGNLYVSDYGSSQILLLRPTVAGTAQGAIALSPEAVILDQNVGTTGSTVSVTLSNSGTATLTNLTMQASGAFSVSPTSLDSLPTGQSVALSVTFSPTAAGPQEETLTVSASNTGVSSETLPLRGLGKSGEPSLQWVLDAYLGAGRIQVGDDNPATNIIHSSTAQQSAPLLGDEVAAQLFEQVDPTNPVSLEVIGVYGPTSSNPIVAFGWYEASNPAVSQELFTVDNSPSSNGQTLSAPTNGSMTFNANSPTFGFFSRWPFFGNRILYSQDSLNTFSGAIPHHVRVYPLPGENNAYVIATEEHITGFDFQDIVVIARNVRPVAPSTETPGGDCPTFDFQATALLSYATNQDNGTATVLDGGTTLRLDDNAWKYIDINYTVTPQTVLSFEFQSTELGEEHAIGLDDDNSLSGDNRRFSLYGTQNTSGGAIQDFKNYNGSGQYQSYTIPVGQYFTGSFTQLFFNADNDAAPTVGNSFFRNVRLFEDSDNDGLCDGDTTTTPVDTTSAGDLVLENLTKIPGSSIGFPSNERYVFSRIDANSRSGNVYAYDDLETIRIHNPGTGVLIINSLTISDPSEFTLPNNEGASLPLSIPAGGSYDLDVQFIESAGGKGARIRTLTIGANAGTSVVTLAGGYQTAPEGGNELTSQTILDLFGFGTNLPSSFPGEYPTEAEVASGALGDIVVSDFWEQAVDSIPVRAMFLYSQRDIGGSQLAFLDSLDQAVGGLDTRFAQTLPNGEVQANTVFPRPAANPTEGTGFSADSIGEPFKVQVATRNTAGNGAIVAATGKPRYLGVKVYQVRNAQGAIIPNQYVALQDFTPGNHDFNDGIVFLSNIKPAGQDSTPADTTTTPPDTNSQPVVLYRVNTGGNQIAAIDDGPLWERDTRSAPVSYLVSDPSGHRALSATVASIDPEVDLSTVPSSMFSRARWDRSGGDEIIYRFPLPGPGDYGVNLYFIEPNAAAVPGDRVFSISLEGQVPPELLDFDIAATFGPQVGGVISQVVSVTDDSLEVQLIRNVSSSIIAGLEIVENPGTGGPPPGQAGLAVDEEALRFEAEVGGSSPNEIVTLLNDGTATLYNLQIGVSGTGAGTFGVSPTSLDSLPAGQSIGVTVTVTANAEGLQNATLDATGDHVATQQVALTALTYTTQPSLQALVDYLYGSGTLTIGDDDASTAVIHSDPATQASAILGDEVTAPVFIASASGTPELEVLAVYGPAGSTQTVDIGWHIWDMPTATQSVSSVPVSDRAVLESPTGVSFTPAIDPFGFYTEWEGLADRVVFGIDSLNTFSGAIPHQVRVYPAPGETDAYLFAVEAQTTGLGYQDVLFLVRNIVPTTITLPGDTTPPTGDSLVVVYRLNTGGPFESAIDGGLNWERDTRGNPSPYLASDPGGSRARNITKSGFDPSVPATTNLDIFDYERWDRGSAGDISYSFPLAPGGYEIRLFIANGDAALTGPGDRVFSVSVEGNVPLNSRILIPMPNLAISLGE